MFMAEQSGKALTAQHFVMNVSNVRQHVARMSSFFIIKFPKKTKCGAISERSLKS